MAPKPLAKSGYDSYPKEKFLYDGEKDGYVCPQGLLLIHRKKRATSKGTDEQYSNPSACKNCQVREKCTKSEYRSIKEVRYQRYADKVDKVDKVDKFAKEHANLVADRKGLVEHLFGVAKRQSGFSYFLTCGHDNVLAETRLYFISYNLKRAINILGVRQILARV